MVYGAVERSNGVVDIISSPNSGTQVKVYLPLLEEEVVEEVEVANDVSESLEGENELVIVAEDSSALRSVITETLEDLGYRVLSAVDGDEFLKLFDEHKDEVELVMLDLVMPNIGGWKAAEQVRSLKPHLPIIFMSGYDREDAFGSQSEMENSQLLTKPFPIDKMVVSIRKLLVSH